MQFETLSQIGDVETMASGHRLRVLRRLNRQYGTILRAELHWYEAHGIGKKEIKFKRALSATS